MPRKSLHYCPFYMRDFFSNPKVQALTIPEKKNWAWVIFSMWLEGSPTTEKPPILWHAYLGIGPEEFESFCSRMIALQIGKVTVTDEYVSFYHERVESEMNAVTERRVKSAESSSKNRSKNRTADSDQNGQVRHDHQLPVTVTDRQCPAVTLPYTEANTEANTEADTNTEEEVRASAFPFLDWWDLYSKKIDRAKCENKWDKLSAEVRSAAMKHTEQYITRGQGSTKQYRRNPIKYLNNENWHDEDLLLSSNVDKKVNAELDLHPPNEFAPELSKLPEQSTAGAIA